MTKQFPKPKKDTTRNIKFRFFSYGLAAGVIWTMCWWVGSEFIKK